MTGNSSNGQPSKAPPNILAAALAEGVKTSLHADLFHDGLTTPGIGHNRGPQLKVLWGAKAIGAFLGLPPRKVFYLLENGLLPGTKIGKTWTATEDRLADHIRGAVNSAPEVATT